LQGNSGCFNRKEITVVQILRVHGVALIL